jgi:FkbM family methyltransferase
MDWPRLLADNNVTPRGVCHVGAHEGQEVPLYQELGFESIYLIEADPNLAADLESKYGYINGITVLPVAAGSERGCVEFYRVLRDSQYNSTLEPIDLGATQKIEVPMSPLRTLIPWRGEVNVLVVDVQGSEIDVIKGYDTYSLDMIVIEVGTRAKYHGQPMRKAVSEYMTSIGWREVHVWPHGPKAIWFDIAYVPERSECCGEGCCSGYTAPAG